MMTHFDDESIRSWIISGY